jgi:hypothetical protein
MRQLLVTWLHAVTMSEWGKELAVCWKNLFFSGIQTLFFQYKHQTIFCSDREKIMSSEHETDFRADNVSVDVTVSVCAKWR